MTDPDRIIESAGPVRVGRGARQLGPWVVARRRAVKLWIVVYPDLRPPRFPRLGQLARVAECWLRRSHDWTDWQVDDVEGPAELLGDQAGEAVWMPLLSRVARASEDASRACLRCDLVEHRSMGLINEPRGATP